MKVKVKHIKRVTVPWDKILLCVVVCALFVSYPSFLLQAEVTQDGVSYRVVFVADDDTLNVRSAPGAFSSVVGTLAPSAQGVRIIGEKKLVGGSAWYPISASRLNGWVMGRYLTQDVDSDLFCSLNPIGFLERLIEAVELESGERLASMVDKERGLRLYLDSWSKGVLLKAEQLSAIFTDSTQSTWGLNPDDVPVEEGTFSENVLPLLKRDLLKHTKISCNSMNHPEASGPQMLPQGCSGVNYISYFRSPGPDEVVQDWGEWVVGVEKWDGRFILSYLAYYKWTP